MRAGPWALARTAAVNLSLVLGSLLVCLAVGEGYLRLFHPVSLLSQQSYRIVL